jgi:D-alanyl-lipoteichoic acid acyltransferase DltB (MBOAT superfamily)
MLFNSITFLLFFSVVLLLHHLPFPWKLKKFNLLIASYIFYAAWSPPFVLLIWLSTIVDWFAAAGMHKTKRTSRRRAFLLLSLCGNLGVLGFFKYGNFALDNFVRIANAFGVTYEPAAIDIILPVGISFYTFQSLSYTLDVYQRKSKPWNSFLDFALYVTFFPQLVAGPIVRATDFLPQCVKPNPILPSQFTWGIVLLLVGLTQKVFIADTLMAPISDAVFNANESVPWHNAWAGTLAFSMQIFCDFAGYSTCAIGAALCLGFALPDNFRYPYAAIGFSDFWRRWHISLSSWLRDYVYIPLGGNRKGNLRTHTNLMFTMLVGGLWHGASWTFVAWGGLHGFYLIAERFGQRLGLMAWIERNTLRQFVTAGFTFLAICFTWILFRAQTFDAAYDIAKSMIGLEPAGADGLLGISRILIVAIVTVSVFGYHWFMRDSSLEDLAGKKPWWAQGLTVAGLLLLLLWNSSGGDGRAFIYFQF